MPPKINDIVYKPQIITKKFKVLCLISDVP